MNFLLPVTVALLIISPCLVKAQAINGAVYDRTGAMVTGARVMLMDQNYVKLAETQSDNRGEFSFAEAREGLHFVQVKKPMFLLCQQHVIVEPKRTAHLFMVLTVARGDEEYGIVSDAAPGAPARASRLAEYRAGGKVEGFKRISGTAPAFPAAAAERGASGTVVLFGTVRTDGTLGAVVPLTSPDPDLLKESINTVSGWRYEPMRLDGVPVETDTTIVFNFGHK
jgi:TonB family protein